MSASLLDLKGRRALVTGASGGLGAHFAKVLAGAGAEVVATARRSEQVEAVARDIRSLGGRCSAAVLDVTRQASIDGLIAEQEDFDILVNNAGVVHEAGVLDQSESDWDAVIDTNLKGMFLLSSAIASTMRKRGQGGSIINIASILGLRQASNVAPYAVSKAGALQLTKTMALELARFSIRVNAIAPGYFETELNAAFWKSEAGRAMIKRIPQRRLGELHHLDGPLLLLASEASAYMTGAVLVVDGGHLVSTL